MNLDPQTYQTIFFKYMDLYADRMGLRGKMLSGGEVRDMFNDVAEEVRRIYKLPPSMHEAYKSMMMVIFYGASAGRKGQERKVVTLSKGLPRPGDDALKIGEIAAESRAALAAAVGIEPDLLDGDPAKSYEPPKPKTTDGEE